MFVTEIPWGDLWKNRCTAMDPEKLVDFVESRLDGDEQKRIKLHLEDCPFCTAFCEDYKTFLDSDEASG